MLSGYSFTILHYHCIIHVLLLLLKKFIFLMWQIYAEMIGNVMIDARSTGKYYHCKYINIQVKTMMFSFIISSYCASKEIHFVTV